MSDQPIFKREAWAVMFDSTHEEIGRIRHLVCDWERGKPGPGVALFWSRKEAKLPIREYYGFTLEDCIRPERSDPVALTLTRHPDGSVEYQQA